jgi:hypothetical protein
MANVKKQRNFIHTLHRDDSLAVTHQLFWAWWSLLPVALYDHRLATQINISLFLCTFILTLCALGKAS